MDNGQIGMILTELRVNLMLRKPEHVCQITYLLVGPLLRLGLPNEPHPTARGLCLRVVAPVAALRPCGPRGYRIPISPMSVWVFFIHSNLFPCSKPEDDGEGEFVCPMTRSIYMLLC